jgi:hypothetical protein
VSPPVALFLAATWEEALAPHLWARPVLVNVIACCAAIAALLAFEPPRSRSPLAYAQQLRARLLELQFAYDADLRRPPRREGEGT